MNSKKIAFYLFFYFISTSLLNAETVYKWIDEDGQVHYGSKADNKNAKEVKIKDRYIDSKVNNDSDDSSKKTLNAKDRANKLKRYVNSIDAENKLKAEEKIKKEEKEKNKLIRCNASRDQLKRAENSGALYDLDEKGNRVLLNKKQYEQAMGQARARVQKWCN